MGQGTGSGEMLKIGEAPESPWLESWTALSRPEEGDWLVLRGPEGLDDLSLITSAAVAKLVAATPRLVQELCELEIGRVVSEDTRGCSRCGACAAFLHEQWKKERPVEALPSRFFTFEGTVGHSLGCPLDLCLNDAGLTYEDRRRVRSGRGPKL